MIISEAEAKKITQKVIALSKGDSVIASLRGHERGHIRFALNSATTSGFQDGLSLTVESNFGKRLGSARTNELDERSIESTVRKAEQIARLARENAEFLPRLESQEYLQSKVFVDATAQARPDKLAALCG